MSINKADIRLCAAKGFSHVFQQRSWVHRKLPFLCLTSPRLGYNLQTGDEYQKGISLLPQVCNIFFLHLSTAKVTLPLGTILKFRLHKWSE